MQRLKEARAALRELRSAIPKPRRRHKTGMHFHDLTGQRFGRLVVSWPVGKKSSAVFWLCICDCGNFKSILASSLKRGDSRSCGCLQSENMREIARKHPELQFPKGHPKPLGSSSFDSATAKRLNAIRAASPLAQAYKKLNAANDMLRQFQSSLMEPAPTKAES